MVYYEVIWAELFNLGILMSTQNLMLTTSEPQLNFTLVSVAPKWQSQERESQAGRTQNPHVPSLSKNSQLV